MIDKSLFHSPVKESNDAILDITDMYIGQKVQIVDYITVFEEKDDEFEDRIVEGCSTGSRHLFLNHKGYLDTFSGKQGTPDMIVLKDDALLLKNFKIKEIA